MLVWVIYDISKDKTRNFIVKKVLEYGLQRVQKSVFLGEIEKNRLDELIVFSENIINEETDSVYIFPMCRKDFDAVITMGLNFDRELVTDEKDSFMI